MSGMIGEYEVTLDEKNRLLVPQALRNLLNPTSESTTFFIKLGVNRKCWMYSPSRWSEISAVNSLGLHPTAEQLRRAHIHFGPTFELSWDKQGRVVIPERMLKTTRLEKDLILVGIQDHVEVWNRAEWEQHMDVLLAQLAAEETQQAQQPQGSV